MQFVNFCFILSTLIVISFAQEMMMGNGGMMEGGMDFQGEFEMSFDGFVGGKKSATKYYFIFD